jgi:hypothetical protein
MFFLQCKKTLIKSSNIVKIYLYNIIINYIFYLSIYIFFEQLFLRYNKTLKESSWLRPFC